MSVPYLPKEDQSLPDNYGFKITYLTGKTEEFELANHVYNTQSQLLEFATKDDIWHWVPITNVCKVEFDSRFSKIVAYKHAQKNN